MFSIRTNKKCVIFRIFFQDFPGPGFSRKKSRTFQEAWKPWIGNNVKIEIAKKYVYKRHSINKFKNVPQNFV